MLRPDKGNGIVLLNKTDYTSKMEDILGDTSKFNVINEDAFKVTLKHEDRVNRFYLNYKKRI